ncbi:MAG TPA: MSMEG_3727 family PQQ-associated protein [Methylophilaceae bacterium]|nr:MSMEG_3727 family PQQ-associated protein [Methylophilaceae bacterium]
MRSSYTHFGSLWAIIPILILAIALFLPGCEHAKLLRPQVLKQLDTDVAALVNELPELDRQNKAIIGRLFAHGGLTRANLDADGVMRDQIRIPVNEYIWKPAIVVMPQGGVLELDVTNEDYQHHMIYMPHNGEREVLDLPAQTRGIIRVQLDQPGYYWFGCPVANHATRGMLGLVLVKGEVPADAKIDRPPQLRPPHGRGQHAH